MELMSAVHSPLTTVGFPRSCDISGTFTDEV